MGEIYVEEIVGVASNPQIYSPRKVKHTYGILGRPTSEKDADIISEFLALIFICASQLCVILA